MAPIKFEENIREKLQERELTPSKDSWEKLSAQLADEPQQKKRPYIWFAVAASFVGVLLLVNFLSENKGEIDTNEIAEEELYVDPSSNEVKEAPSLNNSEKLLNIANSSSEDMEGDEQNTEKVSTELATTTEKVSGEREVVEKKISEISEKEPFKKVQENNGVAAVNKTEKQLQDEEVAPINKMGINSQEPSKGTAVAAEKLLNEQVKDLKVQTDAQFIEGKINEVVAVVKDIQEKNNDVKPEEIDALLRKAHRDIATNRILNQDDFKIDAAALLKDVEYDLERTFRDRVFEALGEGYNKVRTAVVERNN